MMVIENKFDLGDLVYLSTDEEQKQRMVTKISATLDGGLIYDLNCGTCCTVHYEKEISEEKNVVISTS
jgi:hypothetical protein